VPTLFCLDCTNLQSVDEVGVEYLKKIAKRIQESGSNLALCGRSSSLKAGFSVHEIEDLFPNFPTPEEAKSFLETKVHTKNPEPPKGVDDENNSESFAFVFCPSCDQKLKINVVGDYLCPKCKHKFAVNQRGWTSVYERLV